VIAREVSFFKPNPGRSTRPGFSFRKWLGGDGCSVRIIASTLSVRKCAHLVRREIEADGLIREVRFDVPIKIPSWSALRILPSSHTNPVYVLVGGKPIRASWKSATRCLAGVDRC